MGRFGFAGDGMDKNLRKPRIHCLLAAVWGTSRFLFSEPSGPRIQLGAKRKPILRLGLAYSLFVQRRARADWPLDSAWYHGNSDLHQNLVREQGRETSSGQGIRAATEIRDFVSADSPGGTNSLLYLHGFRIRLRRRPTEDGQKPSLGRHHGFRRNRVFLYPIFRLFI